MGRRDRQNLVRGENPPFDYSIPKLDRQPGDRMRLNDSKLSNESELKLFAQFYPDGFNELHAF
jgi:hypothetical protein